MNKKNKNNDIHDSTTDFFLKIVKNEENTQKNFSCSLNLKQMADKINNRNNNCR